MNRQVIKYLLWGAIGLICGSLTVIVMVYRSSHHALDKPPILYLENQPDIQIKTLHHVSKRDGKNEWTLDAKSASYYKEDNYSILVDMSVRFHKDNGQDIILQAKEGQLDMTSNNFEARGNVVLSYDQTFTYSEYVKYIKNKHQIIAPKVDIKRPLMTLSGNNMLFDLNTKQVTLSGDVKGECVIEN